MVLLKGYNVMWKQKQFHCKLKWLWLITKLIGHYCSLIRITIPSSVCVNDIFLEKFLMTISFLLSELLLGNYWKEIVERTIFLIFVLFEKSGLGLELRLPVQYANTLATSFVIKFKSMQEFFIFLGSQMQLSPRCSFCRSHYELFPAS